MLRFQSPPLLIPILSAAMFFLRAGVFDSFNYSAPPFFPANQPGLFMNADLERDSISISDLMKSRNKTREAGKPLTFIGPNGDARRHAGGHILFKIAGSHEIRAMPTPIGLECEAVKALESRGDIAFAELDFLQERQFTPNDRQLFEQWHHDILGSREAWDYPSRSDRIRLAVVDTAFQMDHEDLAAHVEPGWNVIEETPVTRSEGIDHSTLTAGLVAAVMDNEIGVAGISRCRLIPVEVAGFTSDIYAAVVWAADQGIRIVNVSWSGSDSETLAEAGTYLKDAADGLLFMSGVNGSGPLDFPNHADIYAVSMTDEADQIQSRHGPHIDFSAPGHLVYSTLTGSRYGTGSGSSFSSSLAAAAAAFLLGVNPALTSEEAIAIMKDTALDRGPAGYDPFYGWGRVEFSKAAKAAYETLPRLTVQRAGDSMLAIACNALPGRQYELEAASEMQSADWKSIGIQASGNGGSVRFEVPASDSQNAFYRIVIR